MHYWIKLKNILHCNKFILLILSFTIVYVYLYCNKEVTVNNDYIEFTGVIENIKYTSDNAQIYIKGKELVLANKYSIDTSFKDSIKIGNKVKVYGKVNIPTNNTNFNTFNYRKYLLSKKIRFTITVDKLEILNTKQNIFYLTKDKLKSILLQSKEYPYLNAFILGDISYLSENIKNSYLTNGISHLFSVSGMHVGFLSSIILSLLNKISKKKNLNYIILFIILSFYTFLVGFTPSIMRSVIFMMLLFCKKKLNLNISTFKLYIFMTCMFLIYNPYYIYSIGFMYSFTISGFLIYYSKLIQKKGYFQKILIISLIAFLASFPISLYNNFELNFFSPILNLVFVPLVTLIIFPLSFIVLFIPSLITVYSALISVLEHISLWCSSTISYSFIFGKPFIIVITFYYILVVMILNNYKRKFSYILLSLLLVTQYNSKIFLSSARITMLDVGQGDSLLLELPFNKGNILIDTGGLVNSSYSLSKNITIPYLKSLSIKKIDYLILSHGDYDHVGAAINLVNNFKVKNVIFNCGLYNDLENELIEVLDKKKIKYYSCIKELNIDNYKLQFLNTKIYNNENDNSSVIYLNYNNYKFLFMGDAGVDKEKDIIAKYNLTNIDFLKVGHHGSNTSSSKVFIDSINPKYSLISVGKNNRYGHPNKEVLNNLENSKIYRTDQDGSIMLKIKNNKLEIETCSQ